MIAKCRNDIEKWLDLWHKAFRRCAALEEVSARLRGQMGCVSAMSAAAVRRATGTHSDPTSYTAASLCRAEAVEEEMALLTGFYFDMISVLVSALTAEEYHVLHASCILYRNQSMGSILRKLNISRSTYYRTRRVAIKKLVGTDFPTYPKERLNDNQT